MENGWIKLHRKMVDWEWYKDEKVFRVFIHLLLNANHENKKWRGIEIQAGQRITSREHLSQELGLGAQSVRTALNKLKSTNEITISTTSKYSRITILKWNDYQQKTSKLTNEQPATNPRLTTNKKEKNEKNNKKETSDSGESQDIPKIIDLFKGVNPSYQKLFGSPPQRKSVERMINVHGIEKLKQIISFLPKSNVTEYMPVVTTPCQLEDKMGQLAASWQKLKNNQPLMI